MGQYQDCLINKTSRRFSEPCTIVFPDSLLGERIRSYNGNGW